MPHELTIVPTAALPVVDTADPATILLLPAWLASQLGAVSDVGAGRTEVDPITREIVRRVPTIPRSRMPTGAQRQSIERRIIDLDGAARPGPIDDTLMHVGELVKEYASARIDADAVAVKSGAYMDALDDLPAWAVREAIRRWRRGEVDADAQTTDFAPRPTRLRAVAERVVSVVRGQAIRLQRILDAEPEDEPTDQQRGEMQRRLATEIRPRGMAGPVEPIGAAAPEKAMARPALDGMEAAALAERQTDPEPGVVA